MKKQAKSLDIVDQMLKYAAELRMEDMANDTKIPEEMAAHTYSAEFDRGMNAYFKKLKRKSAYRHVGKVVSRVAVILLAFIAVSTTVVMSVDALRVPALEFFGQTQDGTYSGAVLDERGIYDSVSDRIKGFYLPSYVPDGYQLETLDNLDTWFYFAAFKNDSGDVITFQNLSENSGVTINSAYEKEVPVKDQTAKLFFANNGGKTLLFKYQNNVFMLTCTLIDEEIIIQIADSLQYYN